MKLILLGLMITSAVWLADAGEEEGYRTFTDDQGRSIQARILEYDALKNRIRIMPEGGRARWAPVTAFSTENQDYIHSWNAAELIMSETSLSIDIHRKRSVDIQFYLQGDFSANRGVYVDADKTSFEVIACSSRDALYGLKIEYRCFIEVTKGRRREQYIRAVSGFAEMNLAPGNDVSFVTRTINIRKIDSYSRDDEASSNYSSEKFLGVWLKVYGPDLDDTPTVRDVYWPENLRRKVAWDEAVADPDGQRSFPAFIITTDSPQRRMKKTLVDEKARYRTRFERVLCDFSYPTTIKADRVKILAALEYDAEYDEINRMYAYDLAMKCIEDGFYRDAILWLERAVAVGDDQACEPLAVLYASGPEKSLHDGPKAIQMAIKAVDFDPDSACLQDLLARSYARNGEYDQAINAQKKAIKYLQRSVSGSDDLEAYTHRLKLYREGTPFTEAKTVYRRHIHAKPSR